MGEALVECEQKRTALIDSLKELGDFRRGTITANYRKCGKANCACAQEGHPGHGPQYLWSATIKGKSYAKNVKLGPEMQKYEEETAPASAFCGTLRRDRARSTSGFAICGRCPR